jgi:hypothetical protein
MRLLILLIIVIVIFGGAGGYWGGWGNSFPGDHFGYGDGLVGLIILLVILRLSARSG